MKKLQWSVMLVAVAALVLTSFPAFAREGEEATGPVPWVSKIDGKGDATLVKQADTEWFEAVENTPISEGDMVWQDKGGKSEVYIDRYSYVRLDEESAIQFDRLSDDEVRLVLTQGRAEVSNGSNRPLLLDVPGQTVVLPPRTKAKVSVTPEGATEVAVRKGEATVEGENGTVKVKKGQRLVTKPDGKIGRLEKDDRKDALDKWSDKRDAKLGTFSAPPTVVASELPPPVAYEMSQGGVWINDPQYGYVWSPTVAPGWAPYREGRWVYRPAWGWTWVSYEPWGWYPYHYGRWVMVGHHWAWSPVHMHSHHWHPGLVFWVEGPDYIAWQPIPWGVSVAVVHTWGPSHIDYYVVPAYITVVHYNHFSYCNYGHYVRPWPGRCVSGCYIGHYPSHYGPRYSHVTHYRTPRPHGYVSSSRAPRDQVVYSYNRNSVNGARPERAVYGSSSRPGRLDGVNSASAHRSRPAANSGARPAGPDRNGATTRPAPGNRANPGAREGAKNDAPANFTRKNPGTAKEASPNTNNRQNPGAARDNTNRRNPGVTPNENRPSRASSSENRPAAGNRARPDSAGSQTYGNPNRSRDEAAPPRKGGQQPDRAPASGAGSRPASVDSNRGGNSNGAAPAATRPPSGNRSGKNNKGESNSSSSSTNSRPSYTPPSGGSSSAGSSSSSGRPSGGSSYRPSSPGSHSSGSGSSSGRSSSPSRGGGSSRGGRSPR